MEETDASIIATLVLRDGAAHSRLLADASRTRLRASEWTAFSIVVLTWCIVLYMAHEASNAKLVMMLLPSGAIFICIMMMSIRMAAADRRLDAILKLIVDKQNSMLKLIEDKQN